MTDRQILERRAAKKRLSTMSRHVLVCVDDDCDTGGKVVKRIRKAVVARGLRVTVSTTKVKCLGICKGGPIVVVYPDGTWYANVTTAVADRIVAEHLVAGSAVDDHVFLRNPLRPSGCDHQLA